MTNSASVWISLWAVVTAFGCISAIVWVESQPIYEPDGPLRRSILARIVGPFIGIILRPGIHLAKGKRVGSVFWSWVVWTVLGCGLIFFATRSPRAPGMFLVYAFLSTVAAMSVAAVVGWACGELIARARNVSRF